MEKIRNTSRRKGDKAFAVQMQSKMGCDYQLSSACLLAQHSGLVCLVLGLCETVPVRSPTNKDRKDNRITEYAEL